MLVSAEAAKSFFLAWPRRGTRHYVSQPLVLVTYRVVLCLCWWLVFWTESARWEFYLSAIGSIHPPVPKYLLLCPIVVADEMMAYKVSA